MKRAQSGSGAAIGLLYGYVKIFGPALYPAGWGS